MSFREEYLIDKNIKNILHVGADRGGELPLYREMGSEKVVWVEANPEVYAELLENLELMDAGQVKSLPFNQLISDVDDTRTDFNLYYGWDAGHLVGNKGMSSMLKADKSWWGSECYKGTLVLNALTLDTFLERNNLGFDFDLLNMDTQGAEMMVARGASKVLENVRFINAEVTFFNPQYQGNPRFEEVNEYFESFGFEHIHTELCGEKNWGDGLWKKSV